MLGVVAVVLVLASLALRIEHRGAFIPGWDFLSAAHGANMLATSPLFQNLAFYRDQRFNPSEPWNVHGAPVVLLPGLLAWMWPWEFWNHIVTFVVTLTILWLVAAAEAVPWRGAWLVLLTWGASSTLLSQSIVGLSAVTGFLPWAVALFVVLRLGGRPWSTLVLSVLAVQLAWQCQELGRTVFVLFLMAVVVVREARPTTRLLWLSVGLWQLYLVWMHPSVNVTRWSIELPPEGLVAFLPAFASRVFWQAQIDSPLFVGLGCLALPFVRRNRWLAWGSFALQATLILVLASNGLDGVWPRRSLMLLFCLLWGIVAAYQDLGVRGRRILVVLLLGANLWQLAATARWAREPLVPPGRDWGYSLPHVYSSVEQMVPLLSVDWYHALRADVDAGRKVLVLYDLSAYDENHTNPSGVLDRLYLHLGHRRFVQSVLVFGDTPCRWNCLPIRPRHEAPGVVEGLGHAPDVVVHAFEHVADSPQFREEMAEVRRAIERHYALRQLGEWITSPSGGERFARFTLAPRRVSSR